MTPWIFTMRFKLKLFGTCLAFLSWNEAYADCYARSFPEIRNFVDKVLSLEIRGLQHTLERQEVIDQATLIRSEVNTNETSLSFNYDITDGSKSLDLNADLSIWKRSLETKIIHKQADIKLSEIAAIDNLAYTKLALSVVSILSSEAYLSIFKKRREILLQELDFYQKRIMMGLGEYQQKLKVEQDLLQLTNKQMSAEIKKQTETLLNEINDEDLVKFISPLVVQNHPKEFICSDIPQLVRKIDQEIDLLTTQIIQAENKLAPSLLGSVSSVWNEQDQNDISGKIMLTIPIYNGNNRSLKINQLKQELLNLRNKRAIFNTRLEKAAKERTKIDQILLASLDNLNEQLATKKELLSKIELKNNLGASVFEEKAQLIKEILLLEEARVELVSSIYNAWLNFVSARGDFLHGK